LAGQGHGANGCEEKTTTATSPGDHQGHIAWPNYKAPATTTTRHAHTAYGDPQHLSRGQAEIATDLGTSPAGADETSKSIGSALRPIGEDLISAGSRNRKTVEHAGEIENCSPSRQACSSER
jgi:hypothetical protein